MNTTETRTKEINVTEEINKIKDTAYYADFLDNPDKFTYVGTVTYNNGIIILASDSGKQISFKDTDITDMYEDNGYNFIQLNNGDVIRIADWERYNKGLKITLEQFLETVKDKPCCIESPDLSVIAISMRGCKVSSACGGLDFENILDFFEIEEVDIDGIYRQDDGEFYIEFDDILAVMVNIMDDKDYNELLKNLKQALSEVNIIE